MEALFNRLMDIFSIEYMFSVIVATYLIIKCADSVNGEKAVPTWLKKLTTLLVGIVLFAVFKKYTDETTECLITSYLAAVFVYDIAIKYLLKKFRIDYFKEDADKN